MKLYKLFIKLSSGRLVTYFKHDSLTSGSLFSSEELLLKQKHIRKHLSNTFGSNISIIRKEVIFHETRKTKRF